MMKAFGKLWLQGAKRLVKAQQSQQKKLQKKLIKTLLIAPAKTAGKRVKRVVGAGQAAVATRTSSATRIGRKPAARQIPVSASAPSALSAGGNWTRSYYSSLEADRKMAPRRMTGWLFVPDVSTAVKRTSSGMPLVVMLHGCEQTAPDFASGTRMNRLAVRHGFAVLYPQQSASAHAQRCWPWYQRALQHGGHEVALVAGMIEKALARHGFDPSRVYVAGLSAGAAMAQTLALRRPDLIAAVASHSGPVFGVADSRMSALTTMQQGARNPAQPILELQREMPYFPEMPVLIVQGAHDGLVRPINGRQLAEQFRILNRLAQDELQAPVERLARGANDAFQITDFRRGRQLLIRLCEVAHLGHAWSGGDPALRYNAARGPDASVLLWNFFKRHRRIAQRSIDPPEKMQ